MPKLAPKYPIVSEQVTRTEYLKTNYPHAANVIDTIQSRIEPFKYGIHRSELDKQYKFVDGEDSKAFFENYFSDASGKKRVNKTRRENCHKLTLNKSSIAKENSTTLELFDVVFDTLIESINSRSDPLVRTVVGPTGAGKTAFSKGLITATIKRFWEHNIIPTRVEYSRFVDQEHHPTEDEIVTFIRKCQLRDLLIYLFFSGNHTCDSIISCLSGIESLATKNKLLTLGEVAENLDFENDSCSLLEIHEAWENHVGYINDSQLNDQLLDALNAEFGASYFISLDGFDIVNVEDFLLVDDQPSPIDITVKILKSILGKIATRSNFLADAKCHFVLYLRDTTYSRLKLELSKTVSGERSIPRNWIVPPTYGDMVHKVSTLVGVDVKGPLDNEVIEEFSNSIDTCIKKHVVGDIRGRGAQTTGTVFGWNARYMKRHIGRMLYYTLDQLIKYDDLSRKLQSAGAGEAWLWSTLLSDHRIGDMPSYHVLEELFLDNSRQLRPKVKVSSVTVTNALLKGKVKKAIRSLDDYGETVGFFDCILNYCVKENLHEYKDGVCLPSILLATRIVQFISENNNCNLYKIQNFLGKLGYETSEETVSFFLYILLKNEVISWHDTENIKTIHDMQFTANLVGLILVKKMLLSVSYFSEALCISETPVSGVTEKLIGRDFGSNRRWAFNCAYNSVIGFNLIKSIEKFEKSNASSSSLSNNIWLTDKMRSSLSEEIGRIRSIVARSDREYVDELMERLNLLSADQECFENLWV